MRHFVAVFGATTLATAATLSGFFLGLAAGSAVLGARSTRWRRPLVVFGVLEIGAAAGAAALPYIVDLYRYAYPSLYSQFGGAPAASGLLKLALAMGAVGVPTFCMGGTLPALAQALAAEGRDAGRRLGRLYTLQLFGATLGALSVPLVVLPRLGVTGGIRVAVAASIATGLAAIVLGRRAAPGPAPSREATPAATPHDRAAWGLSALSGAATLALQSLWTRMFALVHENSIYSFAAVLVVFLVGLAGGAALAERAMRRFASGRLLAWAWAAGGLLVMLSPRVFHALTDGLAYLGSAGGPPAFGRLLVLTVVIVCPATIALGMAVPLLITRIGGGRDAGAPVGRLLAANTVGAIVGPLLATFVLSPRLGLWWSLTVIGGVMIAAAAAAGLPRRAALAVALSAVVLGIVTAPGALPPVRVQHERGETLVSVREGSYGTTAVLEDGHDRWMTVNNSYVLGGTAEADEERFQAHLPLSLHPAPRRVAFLGLGTGITAGAALLHPVDRMVAVEIVPEVVVSAREDFAAANDGIVGHARAVVLTDDARTWIAASPAAFDVIVGDLLVPWRPAEAALYSKDHFEQVRRALAPGGVFCQWLPLYQLSDEQAAILVRTFVDVFADATLWRGNFRPGEPTAALVGRATAEPLDAAAIDARVRALALRPDVDSPFLVHPAGLWLFLVGAVDPASASWADVRRHTDAHPWLELLHPSGAPAVTGPRVEAFHARFVAEGARAFSGFTPSHREWMRTGAALWNASQGTEDDILAVLRTLPAELQEALEVTAP